MERHIFFNAHHSPVGAFASFTLGFPGAKGGFGLELGRPANQSVFIGAEGRQGGFEALPFFAMNNWDESARYDVEQGGKAAANRLRAFGRDEIRRDFQVATDTWTAGDITFRILSPVRGIPEPSRANDEAVQQVIAPAVLAELTLDNTAGTRTRKAFFGFNGNDPYKAMTRLDDRLPAGWSGIGEGRHLALVSDTPGVYSGQGFSIDKILAPEIPENLVFGLGGTAALCFTAAPGERKTARFAVCFFRDGIATARLETSYYYTRYFRSAEAVGAYVLGQWATYAQWADEANALIAGAARLSADQKFQLAHAIRSYFGSAELLMRDGKPLWVVNEGEYRMINTFDLTVDHLFFELRLNPWVVRNVLDLFVDRYSYRDGARFPGDATVHPGGLSFTHDMGIANVFTPEGHSSYELYKLHGCFSHMTHEQLVNWVLCACTYVAHTGDKAWRRRRLDVFEACLDSLVNRDHPDPAQRNGIMGLDSSRILGGSEITTYDSLDKSLGQARNNLYLGVKTWAAYVLLDRLFKAVRQPARAAQAREQAGRAAATLVSRLRPEGYIPAVIDENNDSRIIPAIEGLVFPHVCGYADVLDDAGPYGEFVRVLRRHLDTVLVKGACLFDNGAWKISSTSNNSWLSKVYLCQFVARKVLGLPWTEAGAAADAAHVGWLLHPEECYWAWSDQMVNGVAKGSKYYPRGVTAILWLTE